ncbi:helix-turn-helix domain-containing protein [Sphingomonas bacterium]|uniref:helix-turn-helix domain-containing protein n=1 Tax=Sphingomonas bacterium TaxID=1895847 RepID=UPI0015768200|nr:helix-turn-helix domain-containing protein [Sphingomonas bacterium]
MKSDPVPGSGTLLPVARYSSTSQRPEDRYPAWREGSLLQFGRLYDTKPLVPFTVETSSAQLGSIGFSHSRMTSQNWHRTPGHIRTDGSDPLMVAIRFEGEGRGDANGRAFDAPAGCIALSDFGQPMSHFSETAFTAVLAIPRAVAERTLPHVRTLHGLVIQPQVAGLLRSHARAMIEALDAGLPAHHAARLGRVTLDLLEIGVARSIPSGTVTPVAAATGARLAAEAVIEQKLGSSTLTIGNLCRWSGVSRSTLYRLFDAEGGVQAFIRSRRLAHVAEELRRDSRERISDIAERWGFCDAAHLSRLFRHSFGRSPSDYRAGHDRP